MATFDGALDIANPTTWTTLDVRVLLTRSTGTAPVLASTTVAQVLGTGTVEITDTGYVRKTLSGLAVVTDDGDRYLDANSPTWTALGSGAQSAPGALVYDHVTDDSDSPPLFYFPFSSPVTLLGSDVTLAWNSAGLYVFDVDP